MPIDYRTGGHVSPQDVHIFVQALIPTVAQGVEVGDVWSDTTASLLKRCTSVAPVTFVSTEGGAAAHDILSATHGDTLAAAVSRGSVLVGNSTPAWSELVIGASGTVPRSDGTDIAFTDLASLTETLTNKTINDLLNLVHADAVHVEVRNETGGGLSKGAPVYVSGFSVPESLPLVALADADGAGTMPALGILGEAIADNANGRCMIEGALTGIDTSSFSVGDTIYISTTPGGFTATKPTGATELIQNMGVVIRSHATLGVFLLMGAGRTNDVPNTVFPVDDATSDPVTADETAAADGTEDSFSRKDHRHLGHAQSHDHSAAGDGQLVQPLQLSLTARTTLTIASGLITPTQNYHDVDTEGSVSSDNLAGMTGGVAGELVLLRPANAARTVVVTHEDTEAATATDRIWLNDGLDYTMDEARDTLLLIYDSNIGRWLEVGRGANTPVTVSGTPDYITLSGQDIVRGLIVLTTDVSGVLPVANGGTGLSAQPDIEAWVSAAAMKGLATAGAGDADNLPETRELATNDINIDFIAFDQTTEEHAFFSWTLPAGWDEGTLVATFYWTAAAGSGGVTFGIAGLARGNDDPLDTALGTEIEVDDTLIATDDQHISAASAAITLGGTPAQGDQCHLVIARKVADGNDTLTADAQLMGVLLKFTRASYTD